MDEYIINERQLQALELEVSKEIVDTFRSHPFSATVRTKQCKTCKFSGLRTCMYHGYPTGTIPKSCEYKIGTSAEDAQCNICTKLRAERENMLNDVLNKIRSLELSSWNEEYLLRNIGALCNKPEGT
jgi:hypothetical protein